jgi:hypothetical protein
MRKEMFKEKAHDYYLKEIKKDSNNLLYYAQFYTNHCGYNISIPEKRKILKKVIFKLFPQNPFMIISEYPFVYVLDLNDIKKLLEKIDIKDKNIFHFIAGNLYYNAWTVGKNKKEYYKKAYSELNKIKPEPKDLEYYRLLSEILACINYRKYKSIFNKLLAITEPEWRGWPLMSYFRESVRNNDWNGFEKYEKEWHKLPLNAHQCECYANDYNTYKCLQSLKYNRLNKIPEYLDRAMKVRGCPHLNSGGFNLTAVKLLIDRNLYLKESKAYLLESERFAPNRLAQKLLKRIQKKERG